MVASDDNKDIAAPLLRPDANESDKTIYERICDQLNLDPKIRDNDTYMQLTKYNQICYMEVRWPLMFCRQIFVHRFATWKLGGNKFFCLFACAT